MDPQTFFIRSLAVQHLIMAAAAAVIVGLLCRFLQGRKWRQTVALLIWAGATLWFFNGPLWGFCAVTVGPQGLRVHYGFLAIFKNTVLPPDTAWTIQVYRGGLRRTKKLYYLQLAGQQSLKVAGQERLAVLESIGAAIDRLNNRPMGRLDLQPVNR